MVRAMKNARRADFFRLAVLCAVAWLFCAGAEATAQQAIPDQPATNPVPASPPGAPPGSQFYGDWSRQCEALPNGQRPQCFLSQNVYLKQTKRRILYIAVGLFGAGQKQGAIVQVPLRLYLPSGLTFEIPDAKPIQIIIEVCLKIGCRATVQLTDQVIEAMKKGGRAVMKLRDSRRNQLNLPISLEGFAEGFASLNQG